jgi:thiamine-phosphate pyrophosphorylase
VILQVITSRLRLCDSNDDRRQVHRCICRQAEYAIEAGVDMFQIREPGLEARDLLALATAVVSRAAGSSTRVIINDRVDVALASGAGGVHLREDSFPSSAVRAAVPAGFVIGCSVHSAAGAEAVAGTADYLIAGTVWPSASKPGASLIGPDGLAAIARAATVPVLAIGGVTLDRIALAARAGASGIAASDLFIEETGRVADGPCRAVRLTELVRAARAQFDTARSAS